MTSSRALALLLTLPLAACSSANFDVAGEGSDSSTNEGDTSSSGGDVGFGDTSASGGDSTIVGDDSGTDGDSGVVSSDSGSSNDSTVGHGDAASDSQPPPFDSAFDSQPPPFDSAFDSAFDSQFDSKPSDSAFDSQFDSQLDSRPSDTGDAGVCPQPPNNADANPGNYKDFTCAQLQTLYADAVAAAQACGCNQDCSTLICQDLCCTCQTFANPGTQSFTQLDPIKQAYIDAKCVNTCTAGPVCPDPTSASCVPGGATGGTGMHCQGLLTP